MWLASPPEVHSVLLSSGPGPGPLLASAAQWSSLSVTYTDAADELAILLGDVAAGAWEGPTSGSYVAAHAPYLAWLMQAGADSAAMAAQQQATAVAYSTALAAMPTMAELAGNHATHAVLTATNFFGINTIPIALNEADYVRMWIQAATVMGTYQVASTAAVAATPQTTPAPPIVKVDGQAVAAAQAATSPADNLSPFEQWLLRIYTEFYNAVLQPFVDWVANIPFLQAMFSGIDPFLLILGNPLTYLSPANIAFALGFPMDIGTYVALLSQTFAFIAADLAAAFATGNPVTIGFTILFTGVEAVGTIITDTIALLKTLLEQTVGLLPALLPLLTSPLLASGAVLAPIGAKGVAALVAVPPPPPPVAPAAPPLAALAPSGPTSAPAPTPAPVEATAAAPAPGPPPPAATAPPSVTGAGVGAHMNGLAYLVGDLDSAAKRAAGTAARRKAPQPDSAEVPEAAATPQEQQPRRPPRRRAKAQKLGRGYEYADLEDDADVPAAAACSANKDRLAAVVASDDCAGILGFAGVAQKNGAGPPAGLISRAGDAFDRRPRMPMVPGTWEAEPARPQNASGESGSRAGHEETRSADGWRRQQRSVS
ncbi:PPE family protein [Mycobacterium spongiae]|nr:PPE family protein [Mycobacterium spongiae]